MLQTIAIAIIGAVGLDRLIIYLLERKARIRQAEAVAEKAEADAHVVQADADNRTLESAFSMLDRQNTRICTLETSNAQLQKDIARLGRALQRAYGRIEYLMDGIRRLIEQIEAAKIDGIPLNPTWRPNEWRAEDNEEQ